LFAGTKIRIGDEDFIVPPISLGQLRNGVLSKLQEHDELVAQGKTFETMEIRGTIILEALRRNYPDFEEKRLFDFLDMANVGPIWLTILGASGFMPGETEAVTQKGNGTLSLSTEASPQPTGGPIVK
jgi:hypothetical protein